MGYQLRILGNYSPAHPDVTCLFLFVPFLEIPKNCISCPHMASLPMVTESSLYTFTKLILKIQILSK